MFQRAPAHCNSRSRGAFLVILNHRLRPRRPQRTATARAGGIWRCSNLVVSQKAPVHQQQRTAGDRCKAGAKAGAKAVPWPVPRLVPRSVTRLSPQRPGPCRPKRDEGRSGQGFLFLCRAPVGVALDQRQVGVQPALASGQGARQTQWCASAKKMSV